MPKVFDDPCCEANGGAINHQRYREALRLMPHVCSASDLMTWRRLRHRGRHRLHREGGLLRMRWADFGIAYLALTVLGLMG